jgi:hypothetical protein
LVNTPAEIDQFLQGLKEQPRPDKRRRFELDKWKKTGYRHSDHEKSVAAINEWNMNEGVSVEQGSLNLNRPNVTIEKTLDSLQWRFFLSWRAKSIMGGVPMPFTLKENNRIIAEAGFHANGNIFFTDDGAVRMGEKYIHGQWYDFKIEADLVNDRYNFLINGKKTGDWVAMRKSSLINRLQISGGESIQIDDITGLKFDTTGCSVRSPYTIEPFLQGELQRATYG